MNDVYAIVVKFDTFDAVFCSKSDSFTESEYPYLLSYSDFDAKGGSFQVDISSAPNEITDQFWNNREVVVMQIPQGSGSIYAGVEVFSGVVEKEPSETNGVYSVTCGEPAKKVVFTPDAAPLSDIIYPKADKSVIGKILPTIFGDVTLGLYGVKLPTYAKLTQKAEPGNYKITVGDTVNFPSAGSVLLGDKTYSYNSKTEQDLVGIDLVESYPVGTQVALVGEAEYLASNHPVTFNKIYSGSKVLTDYDSIGNGIRFAQLPTYETLGSEYVSYLQFDRAATGSYSQTFPVKYTEGETLKPIDKTSITTQTVETPEQAKKITASLDYQITSRSYVGVVLPKGNLTYKTIYNSQGDIVTYSEDQLKLYRVNISATKTVTIPSGTSVSVTLNKSTSREMDLYSAYDIVTSLTINGNPVSGSTTITSTGTVTIQSSSIIYFGVRAQAPHVSLMNLEEILRKSSLNEVFAKLAKSMFVYPKNYDFYKNAVLSWNEKVDGNVATSTSTPSASELAMKMESVTTTYDLDTFFVTPSTLTAGNYTFQITCDAPLRSDIGHTPTTLPNIYQASIGGVNFTLPTNGGVVNVVVPLTASQVVRVRHVLNYENISVNTQMLNLFATQYFEQPPAYTKCSSINLFIPKIVSITTTWSNSSISNACLNATNAIRYVTNNNVNQTASFISAIDTATGQGFIQFPPSSSIGEGIIKAFYQVYFTVNLQNYKGPLDITIGNTLVYTAEQGIAIYNWSPCYIQYDENTNLLPIKIVGDVSQVSFTIQTGVGVTPARLALVGNVGEGKYATLAYPSNTRLRVIQVDENIPRGKIQNVYLAVEWFQSGRRQSVTPSVSVSFDGKVRGNLYADTTAGSTTNQTVSVSVDSNNPGRTTLTNTNITQAVTGGTAAPIHSVTHNNKVSVPAILYPLSVGSFSQGFTLVPSLLGWKNTSETGNIVCRLIVQGTTYPGDPGDSGQLFSGFQILNSSNTTIYSGGISSTGLAPWTTIASNTYQSRTFELTTLPAKVVWSNLTNAAVKFMSIELTYSAKITDGSLSINNVAAGGGTYPSGSPQMPVTNLGLITSGGNISVTVPDSPRTTVSLFPLSEIKNWSDLTNKTAELVYDVGISTLNVNVVQVQLAAEYVEDIRSPISDEVLVGDVSGMSGNPADAAYYLATECGYDIDMDSYNKSKTWFDDNNYVFSRCIRDKTETLTLLTYAYQQAGMEFLKRGNTVYMIRWFDLDYPLYEIEHGDLLEHPTLEYVDRIENDVTFNYDYDYVENGGFKKVYYANQLNNNECAMSVRNSGEVFKIDVDCGFIKDKETLEMFSEYYTKRHARLHKQVVFKLPYTYEEISVGYLTKYRDVVYRVLSVSKEDVWITLVCEEVVS